MEKIIKMSILLLFVSFRLTYAQEIPEELTAIGNDNAEQLGALINKDNINACYLDKYTLLAETIRLNAGQCFKLLLDKGADVNKACGDYLPPVMFAAKYGRVEMLKTLVSKGADKDFKYHGSFKQFDGETPLTYAEKYHQSAVVSYLKTLPVR